MTSSDYPGVTARKDRNGDLFYRYRSPGRDGKETRLPGEPGDPAFEAAYRKVTQGQPLRAQVVATIAPAYGRAAPRTFWAAARRLETTMEWQDYDLGTRELYQHYIERFLEMRVDPTRLLTWRDVPVEDLDADRLRAIVEGVFASGRTAAKHTLLAIKKLLWVAIELEKWMKPQDDPALSIRVRVPESTANPAWPIKVREKFEARHPIGSTARTAYALGFWLGNRRSDVVAVTWDDLVMEEIELFDGTLVTIEAFEFRQRKNRNRNGGKAMFIPVVDKLAAALAPLDRSSGGTVLKNAYGRAYAADSLTGRMADWCAEAVIEPGYTMHGLRHTWGTYLAECNVQARAIMEAMGHSKLATSETYVKEASRKLIAVDIVRAVNAREDRRDAMKRRSVLRVVG